MEMLKRVSFRDVPRLSSPLRGNLKSVVFTIHRSFLFLSTQYNSGQQPLPDPRPGPGAGAM